jgi:hypothetical protein
MAVPACIVTLLKTSSLQISSPTKMFRGTIVLGLPVQKTMTFSVLFSLQGNRLRTSFGCKGLVIK